MATAYILITVILIIGGLIATVGDRIGTRVGKKRLSLFNLRPKNTAVLVTILTGVGIAGSTLGILFLADDGLRKGVFELENIQKDLRRKRVQLKGAETQINQVTGELAQAKNQQAEAQKRLEDTNKYLQEANKKQKETQTQLNRTITQQARTQQQLRGTQSQLGQVVAQYQQVAGQYQQARAQLQNLYDERKKLQQEIVEQKAESERLFNQAKTAIAEAKTAIQKRDRELAKRKDAIEDRDARILSLDRLIQERNIEINAREQVIAKRESRLKELEKQQDTLEQEVARLEKYYQSFRDLRLGKLALIRGQVIAEVVVSVQQPSAAREAAINLLQRANRQAIVDLTEPGSNPPADFQILQISNEQIQLLSKQISSGRQYVVRVYSAGNYVRGEKRVEFFTDATLNQIVFKAGEVLASTTADPKTMTSYQMRQRLDLLISASQFRARNASILRDIQIDSTFLRFIAQLQTLDQPIEVQAIAASDTYTAGPLMVKLIAILNGQVIFST